MIFVIDRIFGEPTPAASCHGC